MSRLYPNLTGVCIGGRGLLIEGAPGSGKTSLALALIDRGATLIGDDGVKLDIEGNALVAHPADATRGLVEIRNLGIVEMPWTNAPISLLLSLTANAPRFVDGAATREFAGQAIPALAFAAGDAVQAIRAEHALRIYGLPNTPAFGTLRSGIA